MKRLMLMLGLVIIIGLVSCTPVQVNENVEQESNSPEPEELEIEKPILKEEAVEPKEVTPTVSKEELDQLKKDLEGMEFEDLGGLSE